MMHFDFRPAKELDAMSRQMGISGLLRALRKRDDRYNIVSPKI